MLCNEHKEPKCLVGEKKTACDTCANSNGQKLGEQCVKCLDIDGVKNTPCYYVRDEARCAEYAKEQESIDALMEDE